MNNRTQVKLRKTALDDLESIFQYTQIHWGNKQANAYLQQLNLCFKALTNGQLQARKCDWIKPGYYFYSYRFHHIYLKRSDQQWVMHRVLHKRRLPTFI